MLDHLFAAFMFKINVDVRGFAAVFRHKAFKHHGDRFRPHIRHTQGIAQNGIGRRSAPLTEDTLGFCELHNVMYR